QTCVSAPAPEDVSPSRGRHTGLPLRCGCAIFSKTIILIGPRSPPLAVLIRRSKSMFRALIRYSQRFALLLSLAAMAAGVASAQTQDKKAAPSRQPTDFYPPGPSLNKQAERVVETRKDGARESSGQQTNQIKILKPTGDQKRRRRKPAPGR